MNDKIITRTKRHFLLIIYLGIFSMGFTNAVNASTYSSPKNTSSLIKKETRTPKTVGILIFDGVQIIDFTGPYEIFGQAKLDVYTVSSSGETITTAMGMSVTPTHSFDTAPSPDLILVPGGHVHEVMRDKTTQQWLQKHDKEFLSVCTGSYILAESQLLNRQKATTFHKSFHNFQASYPEIHLVTDERYVDAGNIITSAGLSSGIDASLYWVGKHFGVQKAKDIAMHIEYDWQENNGFIRGKMADRLIPRLRLDFPEEAEFHHKRTYYYGNESHWKANYTIETNVSADTVFAMAVNQLENTQTETSAASTPATKPPAITWQAQPSDNPWHKKWHYTDQKQVTWELSYELIHHLKPTHDQPKNTFEFIKTVTHI